MPPNRGPQNPPAGKREINQGTPTPESKNRRRLIALGGTLILATSLCIVLGLYAASQFKIVSKEYEGNVPTLILPIPTATLPATQVPTFIKKPDEPEAHFFQTPRPIPGTINVPEFQPGFSPPAVFDPGYMPSSPEVLEALPFTKAEADAAWAEFTRQYPAWKQRYLADGGNNTLKVLRSDDDKAIYPDDMGKALIFAAFNNDKETFDKLMATVNANKNPDGFMPSSVTNPSADTRAEEDIAFALTEAARLWGADYATDATAHIQDIRTHMVGPLHELLPGDNIGGSGDPANPVVKISDFAPRYYERFAQFDPEGKEEWELVTLSSQKIMDINFARNPNYEVLPGWSSVFGDPLPLPGVPDAALAGGDSLDIPALQAMEATSGTIPSDVIEARRLLARYQAFFEKAGSANIYNLYTPDGAVVPGRSVRNGQALAGALPGIVLSPNTTFRNQMMAGVLSTRDGTYGDDTQEMFSLLAISGRTGN